MFLYGTAYNSGLTINKHYVICYDDRSAALLKRIGYTEISGTQATLFDLEKTLLRAMTTLYLSQGFYARRFAQLKTKNMSW